MVQEGSNEYNPGLTAGVSPAAAAAAAAAGGPSMAISEGPAS